MPYIEVATNVDMDDAMARDVLSKLSGLAAEMLGKPEKYVLARVTAGQVLSHGGSADPAAYVTLRSIGLPKDGTPGFSAKICGFLQAELGVSGDKVYIDFSDIERSMFGWNGSTF
jgi:phenylpyruvate tautomerase PptA (4-oxalocrotonate tautomerase family)